MVPVQMTRLDKKMVPVQMTRLDKGDGWTEGAVQIRRLEKVPGYLFQVPDPNRVGSKDRAKIAWKKINPEGGEKSGRTTNGGLGCPERAVSCVSRTISLRGCSYLQ